MLLHSGRFLFHFVGCFILLSFVFFFSTWLVGCSISFSFLTLCMSRNRYSIFHSTKIVRIKIWSEITEKNLFSCLAKAFAAFRLLHWHWRFAYRLDSRWVFFSFFFACIQTLTDARDWLLIVYDEIRGIKVTLLQTVSLPFRHSLHTIGIVQRAAASASYILAQCTDRCLAE